VKKWKTQFLGDRTKRLAQKACTHYSTLTLMSDNDPPLSHVFNTKVGLWANYRESLPQFLYHQSLKFCILKFNFSVYDYQYDRSEQKQLQIEQFCKCSYSLHFHCFKLCEGIFHSICLETIACNETTIDPSFTLSVTSAVTANISHFTNVLTSCTALRYVRMKNCLIQKCCGGLLLDRKTFVSTQWI